MKKIPTVFVRDPDNRHHVTKEVTPGCEWVLAGEGAATRKYDGTCILLGVAGDLYSRREVKPGKEVPPRFTAVEYDPNTGKTVGWEPAQQSGFARWLNEALDDHDPLEPGTYELCGPKVNGNPEGFDRHVLISHATAERVLPEGYRPDFESMKTLMSGDDPYPYEGIVWHHPDGRMAKLKRRDFR